MPARSVDTIALARPEALDDERPAGRWPPSRPPRRAFAFGPYVLIPDRQSLSRDGVPVPIGARALDLLTALVERPGEMVSKRELVARAWPDTFVSEGNLKVNIATLRKTLGDPAGQPHYIGTVTGHGYRFVATVREGDASGPQAPRAAPTASRLMFVNDGDGPRELSFAIALGRTVTDGPTGRVSFVDLSLLEGVSRTAEAIAAALFEAVSDALAPRLHADPRARGMLLILGNAEDVAGEVAPRDERITEPSLDPLHAVQAHRIG